MTSRWQALRQRYQQLALMQCGMRPFYVLTAFSACAFMLVWLGFLSGQAQVVSWLAAMPGGAVVWHAQELLFGFVLAAVVGFLLVAVPEFTESAAVSLRQISLVLGCWLAARVCAVLAPLMPTWLAVTMMGLSNGAVCVALLAVVVPRVRTPLGKAHRSFCYVLLAVLGVQSGFFIALGLQQNPMLWLYATVGAVMVLVLIAAGRISMRIMNSRIEQGVLHAPHDDAPLYLARPPRRNFAVFAISLCSVLEFFQVPATVTGWVALATAAAVLHVLNDWHVGRPLYNRWALMLYACYWCLSGGYALMGLAWLGAPWAVSAGRHLLMVGTMGLSIFVVMCIAGRQHCGYWLDTRRWVAMAAAMIVLSALARVWSALPYTQLTALWLGWSGALWVIAYAVFLGYMWTVLLGPRPDQQSGCAEPVGAHNHHGGGCG